MSSGWRKLTSDWALRWPPPPLMKAADAFGLGLGWWWSPSIVSVAAEEAAAVENGGGGAKRCLREEEEEALMAVGIL